MISVANGHVKRKQFEEFNRNKLFNKRIEYVLEASISDRCIQPMKSVIEEGGLVVVFDKVSVC